MSGQPSEGIEPFKCLLPSYAAKYDVECFAWFRQLPSFTFYMYKIDIAANGSFLAIFGLSLLGYLGAFLQTRRTGRAGPGRSTAVFTAVMCLGAVCEMIGYAARVKSWHNRSAETPFLIQIIALTIGPAFTAAGIYICLRRIVEALGAAISLVRPRWYTHGFIGCDVASLALQGIGGGMASVALRAGRNKQPGTRVMLAGMVLQVATLSAFLGLTSHFAFATWRRYRRDNARTEPILQPAEAGCSRPAVEAELAASDLRRSRRFRGFVAALFLSALCLFVRCIYRVAELSEGWTGPLMKRQDLFIAFEGVMVAVAMVALNVFHPAFCMKPRPESKDVESDGSAETNDSDFESKSTEAKV